MKKTFKLTAPNKKPERQVDSVKYEIRKYIARERRKKLPEGADYWGFDCRIGDSELSATPVNISGINSAISGIVHLKHETFYMEIIARPCQKTSKDPAAEKTANNI